MLLLLLAVVAVVVVVVVKSNGIIYEKVKQHIIVVDKINIVVAATVIAIAFVIAVEWQSQKYL